MQKKGNNNNNKEIRIKKWLLVAVSSFLAVRFSSCDAFLLRWHNLLGALLFTLTSVTFQTITLFLNIVKCKPLSNRTGKCIHKKCTFYYQFSLLFLNLLAGVMFTCTSYSEFRNSFYHFHLLLYPYAQLRRSIPIVCYLDFQKTSL